MKFSRNIRMPERRELTRPPLERMLRIHRELSRNRKVNCTQLSELLEVCRKTVVRDIAFMKDRLQLPIDFDYRTRAYRYTEPVTGFPTVHVSEGELVALLVAQRALAQYEGTPFHDDLQRAFQKLTLGLKDLVSFSPTDAPPVSFHHLGVSRTDLEMFRELSRAVLTRHAVEFEYRKPSGHEASLRLVYPYHLANRENFWYLVAFDIARGELRTFALTRIGKLRTLSESFRRPADFSIDRFFSSALGVMGGDERHEVVIRFRQRVAPLIQERVWHHSQKIEQHANGDLVLRLTLGALGEVERWILSWGADAEVVGPNELRTKLAHIGQAIATAHRGAPV